MKATMSNVDADDYADSARATRTSQSIRIGAKCREATMPLPKIRLKPFVELHLSILGGRLAARHSQLRWRTQMTRAIPQKSST
jgi:hypothetical protein